MFAKLFESPKYGQTLAKLDTHQEEHTPEVRFYVQPKNLGVCSFALGFKDDDRGWELAEQAFEETNLELAEEGIAAMFRDFPITVEFGEEATDA
ncbi:MULTISPECIES: hypothetical protein [unclassified Halomonas]|uniref:hypothetical protein n=1 Tax=unclassified Halomonas TaxID=2609666 RepID=UPI00288442F6|nr:MULTISPECIES: hypothetical protein [unclassified Halomonas]MDT0501609.1 hypothetical protein [Halomonas sp. PAR7]MDT0511034.1 hypothetical protein [Halomonas sp. LES1]MDT0592449.1 hypothetical protein [Halomonas sp. PAR8]